MDALKDRFQLILLDSRGHGKSGKPHDIAAYAYAQQVGDVVAVVNDLGIRRFHFCGYSLGAEIGFLLAALFPERVKSLITYGDHPYKRSPSDRAFVDEIDETLGRGMRAWVDETEAVGIFTRFPEPMARNQSWRGCRHVVRPAECSQRTRGVLDDGAHRITD